MLSEIYAAMMRVNDENKIGKFIAKLKIAIVFNVQSFTISAQLARIYVSWTLHSCVLMNLLQVPS